MGKGPMWGEEGRERLKDGRHSCIFNKSLLSPKACMCKKRVSPADGGLNDDHHCNTNNNKGRSERGEGRAGRGLRVVQIFNPVFVETDVHNFPSLVQMLTGKSEHSCCCRGSLEAMARAYNNSNNSTTTTTPATTAAAATGSRSRHDDQYHPHQFVHHHHHHHHHQQQHRHQTSQEEQELEEEDSKLMAAIAAASASSPSSSSPSNSNYNSNSSPPSSSSSSSYNSSSSSSVASLLNRCASLKGGRWLWGGGSSSSELDLWAGLVSETPLPDITLLPPLL